MRSLIIFLTLANLSNFSHLSLWFMESGMVWMVAKEDTTPYLVIPDIFPPGIFRFSLLGLFPFSLIELVMKENMRASWAGVDRLGAE